MSTLVLNPTYQSLDILYEADLDSIRVPLQNFLNVTGLDSTNVAVGSLQVSNLAATVQNTIVQTGMIVEYYGATLPSGYLWCNGATYTTNQHAALYDVITTTYGGSIGVNFQVPDKRDKVSVGLDTMGGTPANRVSTAGSGLDGTTIGAVGGNENLSAHTHGASTMSALSSVHSHATSGTHNHPVILRDGNSPAATVAQSAFNFGTGTTVVSTEVGGSDFRPPNVSWGTTGSIHQHTGGGGGASGATGTNAQQSVVQPSAVCGFIIKT